MLAEMIQSGVALQNSNGRRGHTAFLHIQLGHVCACLWHWDSAETLNEGRRGTRSCWQTQIIYSYNRFASDERLKTVDRPVSAQTDTDGAQLTHAHSTHDMTQLQSPHEQLQAPSRHGCRPHSVFSPPVDSHPSLTGVGSLDQSLVILNMESDCELQASSGKHLSSTVDNTLISDAHEARHIYGALRFVIFPKCVKNGRDLKSITANQWFDGTRRNGFIRDRSLK